MGDQSLISREIKGFVSAVNRRNRLIVTSHIAGYHESPLNADFLLITLRELELELIHRPSSRLPNHRVELYLLTDVRAGGFLLGDFRVWLKHKPGPHNVIHRMDERRHVRPMVRI